MAEKMNMKHLIPRLRELKKLCCLIKGRNLLAGGDRGDKGEVHYTDAMIQVNQMFG